MSTGETPRPPRIGRLEIAFAVSVAGVIGVRLAGGSMLASLLLGVLALGLGTAVAARLLKDAIPRMIWRLRNRLIVAYFFIGVIPVLAILLLAHQVSQYLAGQAGVYLVHSELERRLNALDGAAKSLARVPGERRGAVLERVEAFYRERFPGLEILTCDPECGPGSPPKGWGEIHGVVVKDGLLYAWARAVEGAVQVTVVAPLTRRWLADLSPDLGEVSIVHFPDPETGAPERRVAMRPFPGPEGDGDTPGIAPPVNRFDIELLWAGEIPVALWDSPQVLERSLLAVHSRLSALLRTLFAPKTPVPGLLYGLGSLFLATQIVSVYLGVSITRRITGAVHDLYEGTERVMSGDFSHRIPVRGKEQIAELSSSFNRMTENLEHLLEVAKEKERMQAELEIAREVQNQLFPRAVPAVERLEIRAVCNPARMVSGDYYDYPPLGEGKIAIAMGDVAGKGISAALLMSTLQSSVRTQVRLLREQGALDGGISTSALVSRLNQQLHADTSPEKYATFCFAVYDDAEGKVTYTNAGHLPPLLVRRGEVKEFDINGTVVGAFAFAKYEESSLMLAEGDLLVFYTDGIVEPENEFGEMFGDAQLKELLVRNAHLETEQILHLVIDAVKRHTGSPELQDDMTLLIARRK